MSSYLEELEKQALRLQPEDRGILAALLQESLDKTPPNDFEGASIDKSEQGYQAWRALSKRGAAAPHKQFLPRSRREPVALWPAPKKPRAK